MKVYTPCQAIGSDGETSTDSDNSSDAAGSSDVDLESPLTAKPQVANGVPVRPSHWGIDRMQIADLLIRLRQDSNWNADNSVYTLVNDYIIPWTRGTGVGYALSVNMGQPQEVSVMISHAWCENTEEFLDTLLRTSAEGDVLFVCALSLYQAEDGCGPSIVEQLGEAPSESPFRRVLENIRTHEGQSKFSHTLLKVTARVSAFLAVVLYYLPALIWGCIPGFTQCAMPVTTFTAVSYVISWRWQDMGPNFYLFLPLSITFGIVAAVTRMLMRSKAVYRGRMVVVPNRQGDLYARLWCVYEIFVAMTLGVRVLYAPTLASAGRVRTKAAKCSSEKDAERIRSEINDKHSFEKVDRAVFVTTRAARWHAGRVLLIYGTWLALFCTACVQVSGFPQGDPKLYAAGSLAMSMLVVSIMYYVGRRGQGFLTSVEVVLLAGAFLVSTLCLQVFIPPEPAWISIMANAGTSILLRAGWCLLIGLVGAKCFKGASLARAVIYGAVALLVLVALWTPMSISLWLWVRSMGGITGSTYNLLMPAALRSCTFDVNPYPCFVRSGTFIAVNVIQVFVVLQAGQRWGLRIK